MIDKIKEKGTLIIIALLATITSMSTISIRDSVIKEHDWKVTSGANLKNDFIYLAEDSVYSYSCPLIRKNGDIIAIALFQFEGRLLVFSTKEMAFSFLMYI